MLAVTQWVSLIRHSDSYKCHLGLISVSLMFPVKEKWSENWDIDVASIQCCTKKSIKQHFNYTSDVSGEK